MSSELSRLYDLADELNCLGPWNWMDEVQLIALRHPTSGEMAYLSVMGAAGEHRSLTLYLGEEALHRFNLIHEAEFMDIKLSEADLTGLILEARQLQVSFETRRTLEKVDLDQIKKLGRKYRGEEWPMFRSFRPGRAPGPVDDLEIDWLIHGLTQILDVATRLARGTVEDSRSTTPVPDSGARTRHVGTMAGLLDQLRRQPPRFPLSGMRSGTHPIGPGPSKERRTAGRL